MAIHIRKAAEGETADRGAAPIFEGGSVWARDMIAEEARGDFNATMVQFAAGARTKPHRHTGDQLLYVVAGIGKVGDAEGEHVISNGDMVVVPANLEHWHGAADTGSPMSHISILRSDSETTVS